MVDESRQVLSVISRFQSYRKLWAAFVMIAFLALLLSMWAMETAGRRAVTNKPGVANEPTCEPQDANTKWTPLEVKLPREGLLKALGVRAACQMKAMGAKLTADWLFLFSYGALNLFIFLFLATRPWTPPALSPVLAVCGVLLTGLMIGADILENAELRRWLGGGIPASDGLLLASVVKWLSIGAAGAIAGAIYRWAPRWWGKLPALPGIAALVLFVWGWQASWPQRIEQGMNAIAVFWFVVFVHALGASTIALRPLEERSAR